MSHPYPNFLIVGMMKAGTTTLYDQISRHPRVVPALVKEAHFFTPDYVKVPSDISFRYEYHEILNYDPSRRNVLYGEATPSYIAVPERIKAFNPNCRIIISLRDPAERAISQYRQFREYGIETRSFSEAFSCIDSSNNYIFDSLYHLRVPRFIEVYGGANVLVVSFEEYVRSPQGAMDHIFRFLQLPAVAVDPGIRGAQTTPASDEFSAISENLRSYFGAERGKLWRAIKNARLTCYPEEWSHFQRY